MIELQRSGDSPEADAIEERLRDLVVAHTVVVVDAEGADADLPVVRDGDITARGSDIPVFLDQLTRDMAEWAHFQSDACYIEDDGSVC
jgi:hypothetical protein